MWSPSWEIQLTVIKLISENIGAHNCPSHALKIKKISQIESPLPNSLQSLLLPDFLMGLSDTTLDCVLYTACTGMQRTCVSGMRAQYHMGRQCQCYVRLKTYIPSHDLYFCLISTKLQPVHPFSLAVFSHTCRVAGVPPSCWRRI